MSVWIDNSMSIPVEVEPKIFIPVSCCIFFWNSAILVHSVCINRKRKTRTLVRNAVEVASVASLIGCANVLISLINTNQTTAAICYDFVYCSMWGVVQFADMNMTWQMNTIFLERFLIGRVSAWNKFAVYCFICINVFMWEAAFTIVPFFCDVNSNALFIHVNNVIYALSTWLTVAYNVYFVLAFSKTVYLIAKKSTGTNIKIIAVKGVMHCMSSSCANIYGADSNLGALLFLMWVPTSLHFLFNFKIENCRSCFKQGRFAITPARSATSLKYASPKMLPKPIRRCIQIHPVLDR